MSATATAHVGQAAQGNGHTAVSLTTTATATDDLTTITGIGPITAQRLADAGITTYAQLATADPDAIKTAINNTAAPVGRWQKQAQKIAQELTNG